VIVECQKCGAPLSVVEGQRLVQCTYCGATSQVRSGRTVAQPQYQPPPQPPYPVPPPQQPYPVQPPPYVYRPAPPGSGGGRGGRGHRRRRRADGPRGSRRGLRPQHRGGSVFRTTLNPNAQATVETIAIGAAEPLSRLIPGVAGGPIRGGSVSTSCRGYFPVAPQYALRVTAMQRVRLTTVGSQDLTMAVRDTSGIYRCDDDGGQGSNPLLDLPLAPGLYPVWIGTYRQRYTAGFSLQVQTGEPGAAAFGSALSLTALPPSAAPALRRHHGRDAHRHRRAAPSRRAPSGSNCRGYIPAAPHLVLDAADYRRVVLVTAASRDLTMVVRDASGAFRCDDDSGGSSQPRVETTLSPGAHQVWIGTYSANDSANFTLSVQSQSAGTTPALAGGISPQSRPTVSVLDLDRGARHDRAPRVDRRHAAGGRGRADVPGLPHLGAAAAAGHRDAAQGVHHGHVGHRPDDAGARSQRRRGLRRRLAGQHQPHHRGRHRRGRDHDLDRLLRRLVARLLPGAGDA
jgi:hypothetical protein